ncbi:MAG: thioesterase [Bacteroidales bacterium]|nr:thioesterase [Bacteroidales bacterium]
MLKAPYGIYDFHIKSYHTDCNGKLTLATIFQFLQECAWDNARKNGFGFEDLKQKNALWVLSKILIRIDKYPKWKDQIQIKTWAKGTEGLFAIRDFKIFKNNSAIANITSYWLIIDSSTHRPQRLNGFNFIHENYLAEHAIEKRLGKVIIDQETAITDTRKVYYSDLDINKHVNNATYIRWITDSYYSVHTSNIREFEINFIHELNLNDEFVIEKAGIKNEQYFMLWDKNQKDICKVRLAT